MKLRDYQVVDLAFHMRTPRSLNLSDPGCQPAGSKVLTATGEWKNIELLEVGERISSPQHDGSVVTETITSIERHKKQEIRRISSKAGSYLCSWNHIIPHISAPLIKGRREQVVVDLPCNEIEERSKTYREKAKLFTSPAVEFPKKTLPLDPYFLGVYLGDGSSNKSIRITINKSHQKILSRLEKYGFVPSSIRKEKSHCKTYLFPGLVPLFKDLDLYQVKSRDRFIPEEYLTSSISQRLELIAGLLDSDGDEEGIFYTTSKNLADQVSNLIRSVGGFARSLPKVTHFQGIRCDSYRVFCSFAEAIPFCAVLSKQPKRRDMNWKNPRNHSMMIEDAGVADVYGFTMTGNSQWYVTDNWVVTHNTGKTPPVCVYLYWQWSSNQIRSVWTMPKSLLKKNRDELMLWSEFKEEDVVIVDGPKAKRDQLIASDGKVFLMGFDCFSNNWPHILEQHPDIDCHVSDEIHLGYGGPESKRTLAMIEAMKQVKYFIGMTGTIINGRLSSVFPSMQVIDPTRYPHGYHQFKAYHAVTDSYGKVVAWTNPSRISDFLRKFGIRHTFEEAYGPEAKQLIFETCQMDPYQREAYDEFAEEGILELEESWIEGTLPGVNFIRARQLMEHPQEFGPPLDKIKYTGKEERLMIRLEHAAQTGQPLIIFSALTLQQKRLVELCEKFKLRTGLINGTVSMNRRFKIDEDFRDGELDVVVASPATAGVGFNWGHVDTMIFASVDPMDSSFVQGYRRAIRGKRDKPLQIVIMEYEDSMDQHMFHIIDKKSKLANDVDSSKERLDLQRTGKKRINMEPKGEKLSMEDFQ